MEFRITDFSINVFVNTAKKGQDFGFNDRNVEIDEKVIDRVVID